MKVKKVANINDNGEISNPIPAVGTMILTCFLGVEDAATTLKLPLSIGQGEQRKQVTVEIPFEESVLVTQNKTPASFNWPTCFGEHEGEYYALFLFRNKQTQARRN